MTVIRSDSGWYAAYMHVEGGEFVVERYPVVGWQCDEEGTGMPLLACSAARHHGHAVASTQFAEDEGLIGGLYYGVFNDFYRPETLEHGAEAREKLVAGTGRRDLNMGDYQAAL
jgi:hypothetical protein